MAKHEWVLGAKVVYKRNPAYKPRVEPADGFGGGKVAKVDRVEWMVIPDANIAAQALLYLVGDQRDYLGSMIGNREYEKPCWSVFVCGTPFETTVGVGPWATGSKEANLAKAKALLAEGGYKGERIVLLDPAEAHLAHTQAIVSSQKLKEAGINVDLHTVDWGTQSARRALKDDPEKNPRGWHIFHTWGGGLAQGSPLTNAAVPSPCDGSNWFGWPCDETLEKIRLEFPMAETADEQKKAVERLQARFYEVVPYIPVGQFYSPVAYRKNLSGVLDTVRLVLWNIEKKS